MMDLMKTSDEISYADLIAQEKAKIKLLQQKIAECELRIEALQSLASGGDALDQWLSRSLDQRTEAHHKGLKIVRAKTRDSSPQSSIVPPSREDGPKKRIGAKALSLLVFIGPEGKSLDQMLTFTTSQGWDVTRGGLRSFGNTYRNKFNLLESPRKGFFKLSDDGISYLQSLKSETPSALTEGVSGTSFQAAVRGGPKSDA